MILNWVRWGRYYSIVQTIGNHATDVVRNHPIRKSVIKLWPANMLTFRRPAIAHYIIECKNFIISFGHWMDWVWRDLCGREFEEECTLSYAGVLCPLGPYCAEWKLGKLNLEHNIKIRGFRYVDFEEDVTSMLEGTLDKLGSVTSYAKGSSLSQ